MVTSRIKKENLDQTRSDIHEIHLALVVPRSWDTGTLPRIRQQRWTPISQNNSGDRKVDNFGTIGGEGNAAPAVYLKKIDSEWISRCPFFGTWLDEDARSVQYPSLSMIPLAWRRTPTGQFISAIRLSYWPWPAALCSSHTMQRRSWIKLANLQSISPMLQDLLRRAGHPREGPMLFHYSCVLFSALSLALPIASMISHRSLHTHVRWLDNSSAQLTGGVAKSNGSFLGGLPPCSEIIALFWIRFFHFFDFFHIQARCGCIIDKQGLQNPDCFPILVDLWDHEPRPE